MYVDEDRFLVIMSFNNFMILIQDEINKFSVLFVLKYNTIKKFTKTLRCIIVTIIIFHNKQT